ncbi:MAG: helix-turn-helix domain-containing protein [Streptosporangiales bacterium]|nr:helix-turn-helix domain-containing protein [Streptosporangiales bacterium]
MTEISGTSDGRSAPAGRSRRRATTGEDPADGIGRRLAAYRAERGMRVSDLARSVGVTSSLISQIEQGRSRPSVSTLFAMAEALELPVDAFFRETPPDGAGAEAPADPGAPAADGRPVAHEERFVVRRAERAVIDIASGVRWERLTPTALNDLEFLELVYGPRAESSRTLYRHPGSEMVVVLSGRLDIYVGFECYHLGPGDSMHFPSALPHRYVNPTDETTRSVTTILYDEDRHSPPPSP